MYYKCILIFFAKLVKKNGICKGKSQATSAGDKP